MKATVPVGATPVTVARREVKDDKRYWRVVLLVAVLVLARPAGSTTPLQPLKDIPSEVNATVPLGAEPATVAVNVTFAPTSDGFVELARTVVLATVLLTTCDSAELVELVFEASPPYEATMVWMPAASELVLQVAVLVLEVPAGSATAPQPLNVLPSAVNATVPVGAEPLTVTVKVTLAPTIDGFEELASVAVLVVVLLTICDRVELAEPLFEASPL